MLLRKRVKAGILLYALLMSAVFALLLNFYLLRVQANERQSIAQLSASQAFLMAEVTKDLATEDAGTVSFNQGSVSYSHKKDQLSVKVRLDNGQSFSYVFAREQKQEVDSKLTRNIDDSSIDK